MITTIWGLWFTIVGLATISFIARRLIHHYGADNSENQLIKILLTISGGVFTVLSIWYSISFYHGMVETFNISYEKVFSVLMPAIVIIGIGISITAMIIKKLKDKEKQEEFNSLDSSDSSSNDQS